MTVQIIIVPEAFIDLTVAVVVSPVTGLGRPRVHLRPVVVAIADGRQAGIVGVVSVPVRVGGHALVHLAIAVVVDPVAGLADVGVDPGHQIVAIIRGSAA